MASWQQIVPGTDPGAPSSAQQFFADPYRPGLIYVLGPTGVHRSEDGGAGWVLDGALQAAITENGVFPLHITSEQGGDHIAPLQDVWPLCSEFGVSSLSPNANRGAWQSAVRRPAAGGLWQRVWHLVVKCWATLAAAAFSVDLAGAARCES
jgi:hypothetical protein